MITRKTKGCDGKSGTAVSADGFIWTDGQDIRWPSPQRYDCHNQVLFVPETNSYMATTRDGFSGSVGRTIGMAASEPGEFKWSTRKAPIMVCICNAYVYIHIYNTYVYVMHTYIYTHI